MKQFYLIVLLFSLFSITSCNSSKKALESGNYDKAVTDASLALKKNKNNKKQALLLEDSFKKATDRDLALIKNLKQNAPDNDATKWLAIYNTYDAMLIREIAVLPLLPLEVDGRQLEFDMPDVQDEANEAKTKASKAAYQEAMALLNKGDKLSAREAYSIFDKIVEFNYDYLDVKEKRDEAKIKGSTNVFVKMINDTGKRLPEDFESDLLTFREGSFSDPWVLYHLKKEPGVTYDYEIDLNIVQLSVGRDSEQQRQFREQKQVIVGYKTVKNSKGEEVQQPQYQMVYADVLETMQTKPISIVGQVIYKDKNGKVLAKVPANFQDQWQNNYAQFRGDQRALSQETIQKIQAGKQPFPTDAQMYDLSGKLINKVVVKVFEDNAKNLN